MTPGTFQQCYPSPTHYGIPISDDTDPASAIPLICSDVTVYAARQRANDRLRNYVLISGAGGGLGHPAIPYAKTLGAKVLAIGAGSKEQFCRHLSGDAFVDFSKNSYDAGLSAKAKNI
ncbi:hypothetical protein K432DRAFT_411989 [Lepidopterella palustris CBS 459.81]|uniref:Alcohol dehydrogenase-like C-terminal domain-containing protein n=1 Tax=Lepidopterella palustris CBS 459.81 TaxID=1314670 RepID=A0A8E2DVY8_9PEZI|nr:hypothetical protein K432DRAFT_411989 [Lepidopterella palustris CBS 459.81]